MSQVYIKPFIDSLIAILDSYMPQMLSGTGCQPFLEIGKNWTGVMDNPPEAWVMPVRTVIDDEGNNWQEKHEITIKFGITGSEADDLVDMATTYFAAITQAINSATASDWVGPKPQRVIVFEHDYGPVYQAGGVLARFPEAHVGIEVTEV